MVVKKGRTSLTSSRPVLKTEKPTKNEALTKEDATLQKKIAKEGLRVKAPIPSGNISLKPGEQISFKKKNETIEKKKSKKGKKLKVKKVLKPPREAPGIISLCNLPHGFFERQLNKFFSQFGEVRQVRLVRSEKTGKSCGYGYVEMAQEIVARIAAQAMHNYLTYGKIIKCRYVNYTKNKSEGIFGEKQFRETNCPRVINRVEAITKRNAVRSDEQTQKRAKQVLSNLNKKMLQLESLGVKLDLNVDIGDLKLTRGKKRKATEVNEKTEEVAEKVPSEGNEKTEEIASDKPQKKRRKKKTKESKEEAEVVTADKEEERVPSEGIIPLTEEGSVPSEEKVISGEGKEIVPTEEKIPSGEEKESVPLEEKESVPLEEKESVPLEVKESVPLEEKVPSSEEKQSVPSNTAEDNVVFEADESDDEIVIKTPPFAKKKLVKITRSSPAVRLTDSAKLKAKLGKKTPTKKDLALEGTPKSGKSKTPKKNKTPKASEVLTMQQDESAQKNTPKKTPMKKNALAETALESTPKSSKSKTPKKNKTPKASEVLSMQQEENTPKKTPMKKDALAETALEGTPKLGKSKTPSKNKTPKASEVQTKPQQASAKKNTSKKRRMSVIGGDENQE